MNILYLHGLHSKLSPIKREILEEYGEVYAPEIPYKLKHVQPVEILKQYQEVEFNVIIGSSMGALNTYIISEVIGRPALMFNPPLVKYQEHNFDARFIKGLIYQQFRLGGQDDVVDPSETLNFLSKKTSDHEIQINIDPQLGHRIPIDIFHQDIQNFFSKLCF